MHSRGARGAVVSDSTQAHSCVAVWPRLARELALLVSAHVMYYRRVCTGDSGCKLEGAITCGTLDEKALKLRHDGRGGVK